MQPAKDDIYFLLHTLPLVQRDSSQINSRKPSLMLFDQRIALLVCYFDGLYGFQTSSTHNGLVRTVLYQSEKVSVREMKNDQSSYTKELAPLFLAPVSFFPCQIIY